jgi:hypothetical protein
MLVPALVLAISAPVAPGTIDPLQHHAAVTVAVQSTKAATDPFGAKPVMSVIAPVDTSGIAKNPLTHR